jgi:hypothetical protein
MTEWHSIETAPKDGTEILVTDGKEVCPCFYSISDNPDYDSFVRSSGSEPIDCVAPNLDPTHWMPMPKPPKID